MGIRVIFDESRASVTSPVPYTKLFSAISADLRCAEPWQPGIKMRFIEEGMSALGQKRTFRKVPTMSALPPKPDMRSAHRRVRFGPSADIKTGLPNPIKTDALFQVR
jgi:hypothetical protein